MNKYYVVSAHTYEPNTHVHANVTDYCVNSIAEGGGTVGKGLQGRGIWGCGVDVVEEPED